VKTYLLYVNDDRYSVPNLDSVVVRDDASATAAAKVKLASSPHYGGVEVWDDDRLVFRSHMGPDRPDAVTH
jgi:hypothetical protein